MAIILLYSKMPSSLSVQGHFFLAVVVVMFASPFVIPFPDPTLLFSLGISGKAMDRFSASETLHRG